MPSDIPVLVVAYKRAENIEKIFKTCIANGVTTIYFAVDGPTNERDDISVERVKNTILELVRATEIKAKFKFESKNLGCAAAVISAIDWFFSTEHQGIILEDDCIPTSDFFEYIRDAMPILEINPDIWLASGTQFFPKEVGGNGWVLSRYPMHWGWATTSRAWLENKFELDRNPPTFSKFVSSLRSPELIYWFAGERRAFYGFTDVWDSIYASNMYRLSKYAIVPDSNFVTNTGNDLYATNTVGEEPYTHREVHRYLKVDQLPENSVKYDRLIRKEFFNIRLSHYFSTIYTMFLDYLKPNRKILPHLDSRLNAITLESEDF
jgi:GR25 family glycosyltransferase involved in LPS biosynthesis